MNNKSDWLIWKQVVGWNKFFFTFVQDHQTERQNDLNASNWKTIPNKNVITDKLLDFEPWLQKRYLHVSSLYIVFWMYASRRIKLSEHPLNTKSPLRSRVPAKTKNSIQYFCSKFFNSFQTCHDELALRHSKAHVYIR